MNKIAFILQLVLLSTREKILTYFKKFLKMKDYSIFVLSAYLFSFICLLMLILHSNYTHAKVMKRYAEKNAKPKK